MFSEAFSLFLLYVAATRVVALRGEGQGNLLCRYTQCSYLAVEYHVMDWRPLPSVTSASVLVLVLISEQTNNVFSVQFFCLDNGRSPVKSSIRPVELKPGGV